MGLFDFIEEVVKGAGAGAALVLALPLCGGVGVATAGCLAVAATVGGVAKGVDALMEDDDDDD